jgi:pseudouridine-5'-phosphate glycosidase
VALESTIISHGMPYPRNLEMAKEVEAIVRKHGAVPATVAIIDGVPKAGLTESDLLKLANSGSGVVLKASTRDIAYACATGATAATTVASTMKLAHLAGISVFATGGIGGVHRGAESTMDISADLLELSRTPVTVVCAGIKSILDIPKSLEVLETNSVPVLSYGTSVFPAFYTNDSGIPSPRSVGASADVAHMMNYQRQLGLNSGVLVAVPNPSPANGDKIQYAINFALTSAKNECISGAKVTPYVLDKVQQLTGGESLESNIALVLNNARVAANIAVDFASLQKERSGVAGAGAHDSGSRPAEKVYVSNQPADTDVKHSAAEASVLHDAPRRAGAPTNSNPQNQAQSETAVSAAPATSATPGPSPALANNPGTARTQSLSHTQPEIVVVGGAVVDLIGHIATLTKLHTSNPGRLSISHGGVGRNIAESLARLGRKVSLATAVADDINGRSLVDGGGDTGIDMSLVRVLSSKSASESGELAPTSAETGHSTAVYNAIHDNHGDLCIGIADMSIFAQVTPEYVQQTLAPAIAASRIVAVDGNITKEAFAAVVDLCAQYGVPVFFEPTSDHKCLLPFHAGRINKVIYHEECCDQKLLFLRSTTDIVPLYHTLTSLCNCVSTGGHHQAQRHRAGTNGAPLPRCGPYQQRPRAGAKHPFHDCWQPHRSGQPAAEPGHLRCARAAERAVPGDARALRRQHATSCPAEAKLSGRSVGPRQGASQASHDIKSYRCRVVCYRQWRRSGGQGGVRQAHHCVHGRERTCVVWSGEAFDRVAYPCARLRYRSGADTSVPEGRQLCRE